MKKTVWATGLFAAIVAAGAFCDAGDGASENEIYANSSFSAVLEKAHDGYLLQQNDLVDKPLELEINDNLQKRYIYECIYHNRAVAERGITTRKLMVVGSDSCGFSDTREGPLEKVARIKEYVTTPQTSDILHYYLTQMGSSNPKNVPDLEDSEQTLCYQLLSDGEQRRRKVSDYVAVVDKIYEDTGGEVAPLSNDAQYYARKMLADQLNSTATFIERDYKGDTCHLALIAEDEYGLHSGGSRAKNTMLLFAKPVADGIGVLLGGGGYLVKSGGRYFLGFVVSTGVLALEKSPLIRAPAGWAYDFATLPLTKWRGVDIRIMDIGGAALVGIWTYMRFLKRS